MDANRLNWDDRVAVHLRNQASIRSIGSEPGTTTYTGDATPLAHTRSYEWCHPISDIIGSLLNAGLHLDFLHEHERLPWRYFAMMVKAEDWVTGYLMVIHGCHSRFH